MSKSIDWGFPLLMLACAVLGFVLATAVVKKDYASRLERQRIDSQVDKAKAHMTTILQLNDCYTNEAFYTLDREIFEIKKKLETRCRRGKTLCLVLCGLPWRRWYRQSAARCAKSDRQNLAAWRFDT